MKVFWIVSLLAVIALAAPEITQAADDNAEEYIELCRLFQDNALISVPGSCDKYIECESNGKGRVHHCESRAYDVKTQKCVETLASNTLCHNRCEGKDGLWVADPTTCHGYFYCHNGEPMWGFCHDDMHFDEAQQMCIHASSSKCIDVSSLCDLVPDKTKFRDESDCSKYYECSSSKATEKDCKTQYFDVQQQACVDKKSVACNAHPIPGGICQGSKAPYVGFKSDKATCRGYFYCADLGVVEDLEPTWGQCPEGLFFSEERQACLNPTDVKCEHNRCDGRGNEMVSSAKNNCHDYLICENGFVKEERTCARDYFFDEYYQACVPDIIYYESCDIK